MTRFDYLYRDAGNFKAYGEIVLSGIISSEEERRVVSAMEAEEFFIAEQVSIPPLYQALFRVSGGPTSSDHAWHTFVGFHYIDPSERGGRAIWGSTVDLIEAFGRAGKWDVLMSPNAQDFVSWL